MSQKTVKQYIVRDQRAQFCGLPTLQLNNPQINIKFNSKSRLCILNSYRKIMMAYFAVYKFKVQEFQTNDKFLIPDFIEKRIQQIPLNFQNYKDFSPELLSIELNVTNKLQEPMIIYTDHLYEEKDNRKQSITTTLKLTDTYNLFKLQEGCFVKIKLGLIQQQPESDDKFRGCFVSVYENEDNIDNNIYSSERDESIVSINTYGCMNKSDFSNFFCTQFITKLQTQDILIRVDKTQTTIVFNNIPLFIVDALLCIHKDYFFQYFQQVMPTTTSDYQSCLILKPKIKAQEQGQQEIKVQLDIAINSFIQQMQELEQYIQDILIS